jgi:glycosyltransferase involved in cell wall biosynthesis
MKIAIDTQAAQGRKTGLGVYVSHLTAALLKEQTKGIELCFVQGSQKSSLNTAERLLWENFGLPSQTKKAHAALLHVPAFAPPVKKICRTVVTVHDLIGVFFDNQRGLPSHFYWKYWLPRAIKTADKIIAVSEHTKKDILEHLGIEERKVQVIYSSGHEDFTPCEVPLIQQAKQKYGIRSQYFLTVGTLEPRKNLETALQAFERFCSGQSGPDDFQLVIVGSKNFAQGRFARYLSEKNLLQGNKVIFTDYVDQADLNRLYSGAAAFIFPSLYEGFGFPLLEAMASHTPVIASNLTALPEIAGNAALLVDPKNAGEIAEAMKALASNERLRQQLIEKGTERINHFSWRKTAREVLDLYRSLV